MQCFSSMSLYTLALFMCISSIFSNSLTQKEDIMLRSVQSKLLQLGLFYVPCCVTSSLIDLNKLTTKLVTYVLGTTTLIHPTQDI